MDCIIDGKSDTDRQTIRKGERVCSIVCEKKLTGEFRLEDADLNTINPREVHLWRLFNAPGYQDWYRTLPRETRRPVDTVNWRP